MKWTSLTALSFLCLGVSIAAENTVFSFSLSANDPAKPALVTIRLENRSGHDIHWMDRWMPSDGILRTKYFDIIDSNGKEAEYTGRFVDYDKDSSRSEYRLLKNGETTVATVDLGKFYTLRTDTDYEVKAYRILLYYDSPGAEKPKWCDINSNHLKFHLEASLWEKILRWWKKGS